MPVAPLVLLSAVVLAFEVFLTKLVSYTVDVLLVYVVLGIAMLGSGAAGSLVAVRRGWLAPTHLGRALAASSIAFTYTLVLAPALFARVSPVTTRAPAAFALATLLTLPFLASGVTVTLALSAHGRDVGRVYAANLVGAAAGCFLPLALLGPLDGGSFMGMLAALAWCAAALYLRSAGLFRERRYALAQAGAFVLTALALVAPRAVFPLRPEPNGQAKAIENAAAPLGVVTKQIFDRWGPVGHIAVYDYENVPGGPSPYPFRFYAQDGTAGSMLVRWDGKDARAIAAGAPASEVSRLCTETIYSQGHVRPRDKVLIIGLGGGPDVQCALYHAAASVDVVEINPTTIGAMTGTFDAWLGGIGHDPRVRYHARDGRSFVRGSRDGGYDLVQLSGVDTKQLLASGALALSENHLYTIEAFDDYLASLAPTGVLSIIRFGEPELMRVLNTAAVALKRRGVEHPERHIVAILNGPIVGALISRAPFTDPELAATAAHFDFRGRQFRGIGPFFFDLIVPALRNPPVVAWDPIRRGAPPYGPYFAALAGGDTRPFEATYPFDISPTTDDRPFFFDLYIEASEAALVPFRVIYTLLGTVAVLALALILGPALWLRSREGVAARGAPTIAPWFFGAVGLAYLFVEVWLLHRFGMYLGDQTYAMSVVLAPLLVGTGLGAWIGERRIPDPRTRVRVGGAAIVALVGLGWFALPPLLNATWSAPMGVRVAIVTACVLLHGVAMGLPFPAGLRWLGRVRPQAVPWCIGINSFASVIATVAVTPLSIRWGYVIIFGAGVTLYALAAVLAQGMNAAPDDPAPDAL
jgi:hypothetical protein